MKVHPETIWMDFFFVKALLFTTQTVIFLLATFSKSDYKNQFEILNFTECQKKKKTSPSIA